MMLSIIALEEEIKRTKDEKKKKALIRKKNRKLISN